MKPMVRHLLIFAPLASAMSAPAFAQVAPTHSGSSSLKTFGSDEAWSVLSEFGACYASRSPASAIALVSTRAGSLEEAQLYRRLFHADNQSCLSLTSELRIPFQIVRGAVAEGLFRKAVAVPAALRVELPFPAERVRNFSDAALCYAATHRDSVKALVLSNKLGSKGESRAVDAILPGMSACIPPGAKNSLQIDTMLIRLRLAEALWRLGVAPDGRSVVK